MSAALAIAPEYFTPQAVNEGAVNDGAANDNGAPSLTLPPKDFRGRSAACDSQDQMQTLRA